MIKRTLSVALVALVAHVSTAAVQQPASASLPADDLTFGDFTVRFAGDGTFSLTGVGWPAFKGTYKTDDSNIELTTTGGPPECAASGRYTFGVANRRVTLNVVNDACTPRRMILDRSTWRPEGTVDPIPTRQIRRTAVAGTPRLPRAADPAGSWPSFRGAQAAGVAEGQNLPDRWNPSSGENILWRTRIPGLAHSSPIVWGNRIFVTSAISSKPTATFKPGLYGDGDASDDRTRHKWMIYAIDKRTGAIEWERVARESEPIDKRHIKSTYASATPATDGRIVVAWFGSQGLHAFDMNGVPRWKVDLGRVNMGAYDIPTFEWGPASSPIIWNNLVIIQCDTQTDSFLLALNTETGETVWKTERDELPSWGTPTIAATAWGHELVTNASNFVRGYDPHTGKELWRLGRSSKITAPTPIYGGGLFIVASGRAPERPIFAVRPRARGDLTLRPNETSNASIAWSHTGRGSYMPTPLIYGDLLYVLANNGVLDAYELQTGKEVYRQRLPVLGSGFSASPVAADGKIYLSNEDGDMLVVGAGREFKHIATNTMGELLMSTPALSQGVIYVRAATHLFAIGNPKTTTR